VKSQTILLVNNRPEFTGIGVYSEMLATELQRLGLPVANWHWQGSLVERVYSVVRTRLDKTLVSIPAHFVEETMRVASQAKFFNSTPKGYGVYHITNSTLARVASKRRPSVVTVHDLIPYTEPRDLSDWLIRQSMKSIVQADHIICVSEHTRRELLRYLPVDPSRVTVVWNGIDHYQYHTRDKLDCRRLLGLPEDATIVLHVGSEEPRKNIPVLLKSFQLVSAHVTNPLLVRLGDATPENAKLISSLGIADRVKYLHGLSDPSLAYGAADVLCFPSKSEGFGLPPLEAMACGCPVVASNGGALGEVVGEAALVIDAEDSAGFAKAMERVLTDSNLRVTLVTRGLARAGEFDWSRCAQETARIYSQVMIDFSRQDA